MQSMMVEPDPSHYFIFKIGFPSSFRYKRNAMRVSKLMRSWPRTSSERAGDLIEYAIANGGRLPHLRSAAGNLYWFQYHCIDVILFLISISFIALLAVCKFFKFLVQCMCSGSKKQKKE